MPKKATLVLEDGSTYEGESFGAEASAYGEVVFNTSMTGYQEILTDPSYAGQIVVPTYPIIGNYGINSRDFESKRIRVRGFVVREHCSEPSHWLSERTIDGFLASQEVPGISGVDTRAITRRLRSVGVMMGLITTAESKEEALLRIKELPRYDNVDFVAGVSTSTPYEWERPLIAGVEKPLCRIVAIDCGLKYNILRILRSRGCAVTVVPATASAEEVLSMNPDGVVLSPGPGDPALLDYMISKVKALVGKKPVMGICLGHQLLAWAFGGRTFKLKFGHRGGNHPVRDIATGRVHKTAQNHGYAVDPESLPSDVEVSHINLNDGTVEGLRHRSLPILSIQYHSEASPGPMDNVYLFDRFLDMVKEK
ncbi:MAG: glutamine-hydrolyzing carbamoyl-phosphate synthase small subunit [Chloroflexi bacterium]|nr:glutamine-hydrolyzing carbamoyl-phosphate synthase small subunit [Chloroflexota bacterium]